MAGENRFTADVLDASGATDHAATYEGFIKYSVALAIACFVVLTALSIFAFAPSGALSLVIGFGGLIVGLLAVIIDIRIGSGKWLLSGAVSAVFALLAAMMLV
jgi:hypothetical protein